MALARARAKFMDRVPQMKLHNGFRSGVIHDDKILLEHAIPASVVKLDGSKWPGLNTFTNPIRLARCPRAERVNGRDERLRTTI
jgi:hypothetical protein